MRTIPGPSRLYQRNSFVQYNNAYFVHLLHMSHSSSISSSRYFAKLDAHPPYCSPIPSPIDFGHEFECLISIGFSGLFSFHTTKCQYCDAIKMINRKTIIRTICKSLASQQHLKTIAHMRYYVCIFDGKQLNAHSFQFNWPDCKIIRKDNIVSKWQLNNRMVLGKLCRETSTKNEQK